MHPVIEVLNYQTSNRVFPYKKWLDGLKDIKARAVIRTRIDRLERGLFGDCEPVGRGVSELKIDYGPGYRVYFGRHGKKLVILLCGGDKSTQQNDIFTSHAYWEDYKRRAK